MSDHSIHLVTQLLHAVGAGDAGAKERLIAFIYRELREMAGARVALERPGGMQATTLVHEAYLKLFEHGNGHFPTRRYFFGAAAEAMRQVLIDYARKSDAEKRGGGVRPVALEVEPATFDVDPVEMLALDEAMKKLDRDHPRAYEVVKLRFFAGLSVDQVAEMMDLAPRTVDAEWSMARAWLYRMLSAGGE